MRNEPAQHAAAAVITFTMIIIQVHVVYVLLILHYSASYSLVVAIYLLPVVILIRENFV